MHRRCPAHGGRLPAQPTSVPNPNSKVCMVNIDTGAVVLAYNPSAHSVRQHAREIIVTAMQRSPLALASSEDGLVWSEFAVLAHNNSVAESCTLPPLPPLLTRHRPHADGAERPGAASQRMHRLVTRRRSSLCTPTRRGMASCWPSPPCPSQYMHARQPQSKKVKWNVGVPAVVTVVRPNAVHVALLAQVGAKPRNVGHDGLGEVFIPGRVPLRALVRPGGRDCCGLRRAVVPELAAGLEGGLAGGAAVGALARVHAQVNAQIRRAPKSALAQACRRQRGAVVDSTCRSQTAGASGRASACAASGATSS